MGNRRFSRKRLFETEKLGKPVDLEAGAGIKDAIVSATQHRNGAEIITEIAVDLGTSKATVIGAITDGMAVGVASQISYLTQLTKAKFGTITEIRAVLLEAPTTGGTNIELEHAADATKQTGQAVGGTKGPENLTTVGQDVSVLYTDHSTLNQDATADYLYVVVGANGAASQFGSGKLLIYIHGFEAPSDI